MADRKPLPAVPSSRRSSLHTPHVLSTDATAHLKRLINYALKEESHIFTLEDADEEIEAWAKEIENALDELGGSTMRGGWMAGIRRRRREKFKSHLEAAAKRGEAEEKDTGGKNKSKASEKPGQVNKTLPRRPTELRLAEQEVLRRISLRQIRDIVSKPYIPSPKPSSKHLFLTLTPYGSRTVIPSEDMGFNLLRSNVGCTFTAGSFSLPDADLNITVADNQIMYGLNEWDALNYDHREQLQVVGGTFTLKGVTSPTQHASLAKILRLCVYVYLSILVEQQYLINSHVHLVYPMPSLTPTIPTPTTPQSPTTPPPLARRPTLPHALSSVSRRRNRESMPMSASGLWSYVSKKTENFIHKASPSLTRRESFDFSKSRNKEIPELPLFNAQPRTSHDSPYSSTSLNAINRNRRFSLLSDIHRFSYFATAPPPPPPEPEPTFKLMLKGIREHIDLFSTSPGLPILPPKLLVNLAEKEKDKDVLDPARPLMLSGDEKAGLSSLLLWEEKKGRAVVNVAGFVRHQEFSALYSEHVPTLGAAATSSSTSDQPKMNGSSSYSTGSASQLSTVTTSGDPPAPQITLCGERAKWITYVFNSFDEQDNAGDVPLGELVMEMCLTADKTCDKPGCTFKRGQHERRWIHNGTRVSATLELDTVPTEERERRTSVDEDQDAIVLWESCRVCGETSSREPVNDGTYLFSFAKFLELLTYSQTVCYLEPQLCEHTTPAQRPWLREDVPLPRSRLNIIRHFAFRSRVVAFSLSMTDEVFEVRVPRLQIYKENAMRKITERVSMDQMRKTEMDGEKRALRREIKGWWQCVAEHMDKLEELLSDAGPVAFRKSLPRLPSVDDAYEEYDSSDEGHEEHPSPKSAPASQPPGSLSAPTSPVEADKPSGRKLSPERPAYVRATTSLTDVPRHQTETDVDRVQLLTNMRLTFQRTEQSLYSELSRTPASSLNDVRRSFHSSARGAAKRLLAWQHKHLTKSVRRRSRFDGLDLEEPEWWGRGCHAVPGGKVIVRENDWGSIIAFTLSSNDYQRELSNLSITPTESHSSPPPPVSRSTTPTPSTGATTGSSFFTSKGAYKLFSRSASSLQHDPDQEGVVWDEPETHTATIGRKEHPRDTSSILSLQSVLRQKADGLSPTSIIGIRSPISQGGGGADNVRQAAWAKPAPVEVTMEAVDGHVSGMPEAGEAIGRLLHEMGDGETEQTRYSSDSHRSRSTDSSSGFTSGDVYGRASSSMLSIDTVCTDATVGPESEGSGSNPPLPPKDPNGRDGPIPFPSGDSASTPLSTVSFPSISSPSVPHSAPPTITSTLTSGLANAMRYVLSASDTIRHAPAHGSPHHALLNTSELIDERPHIKYEWTVGNRLKFSCTAYYAKQFDSLRKKCGVEDIFVKSLEKSANWAAEGGKSKSNFWKTKDERFIIKTLVNAWNVADLQVLIELAPLYFHYMESTASKPTVLAKLLGFYTVEIRNLENGSTQAKADLLVMENLFYDQEVVKTFDLKGIQGRKVKERGSGPSNTSGKTLFDGDWIEGQQRALILLHPYSKVVLQEAIKSDSDFLAKSNIMDYSLLLGLDEEHKQIACGLVDTIGSYTFAKTLEYKAKHGLNPTGKEVTVIPPQEYQCRFVNAMDGYFLACPDKWSKPMDDTKVPTDVWELRCPL